MYEGLTFGLREALQALGGPAQPMVTVAKVSGGSCQSPLWNQIKADVMGLPVVSSQREAAALGAAMLAGVATGTYASFAEAVSLCSFAEARYEPRPAQIRLYDTFYDAWRAQRAGYR